MLKFPRKMSDVPPNENEGESLTPGTHRVQIANVGGVVTSSKGKPYSKVIFRNDAGMHTEYYYLTEAALWRWRQLILAAGYLPDTVPQETDPSPLFGREVEIDLRLDGEYVKIDRVRPLKGAEKPVAWPEQSAPAPTDNTFADLAGESTDNGPDGLPF